MSQQDRYARHGYDEHGDQQFDEQYYDQQYDDQQTIDEQYWGDTNTQPSIVDQFLEEQYYDDGSSINPRQNPLAWLASLQTSVSSRVIFIVCGAFIVAIIAVFAIVFGYVLPNRELQAAMASFNQAVQTYDAAQSDLSAQLTDATALAQKITTDDVADPATLDTLNAQISSAKAQIAPAPAAAAHVTDIDQQTSTLTAQTLTVQNAVQPLKDAVSAVQQSRINLATSNLSDAIDPAQQVYDESNWLGNDDEALTELQTQLEAAQNAVADPTSFGYDTDTVVNAMGSILSALNDAVDAVNTEVTAAANQTYTYTLYAAQITCGINLCADANAVSVKVTVKGTAVTANVCFSSDPSVDPSTCAGSDVGWVAFAGTRTDQTAVVQQKSYATAYTWATISFGDVAPNSPAVMFTGPDNCERVDGSYGTLDWNNACY